MRFLIFRCMGTAAIAAMLLASCQTAPERAAPGPAPEFPAAEYERLAVGQGQVYRLDPQASSIQIYVYRAGALAAKGHNHVISAPRFQGAVFLPAGGSAPPRFDVVVDVTDLEIDPPAARRALGGSFGSEVDDEAREGTRRNMLDEAILDAERFPRFALRSLEVAGELPKLAVKTAITLHGVTREQWLPVDVQLQQDRLVAQGALTIRQQEFGIEPFSALGGLLRVQDPLVIEYRLVGVRR